MARIIKTRQVEFEVPPELNIAPEEIELKDGLGINYGINAIVDKNNGNKHLLYLDKSKTLGVIKIILSKSGDNVETCPIIFSGSNEMVIDLDLSSKIMALSENPRLDDVERFVIKNSNVGLKFYGSSRFGNIKTKEVVIVDCDRTNIECNRDLDPQIKSIKAHGLQNITINLRPGRGYEYNLMNLVCPEKRSSIMIGLSSPEAKNNCQYTITNTNFKPHREGDSLHLLTEEVNIEGRGLTITHGKDSIRSSSQALISKNGIYIRPRSFDFLSNIGVNTVLNIAHKNTFEKFTLILDPKLTKVSLDNNARMENVNFTYISREPLRTSATLKLQDFYSDFKEMEIGGSFICEKGAHIYDRGGNSKVTIGGKNIMESTEIGLSGKHLYGNNVFKSVEIRGYKDSSEQDFEFQSPLKKRSFNYAREIYGGSGKPLIEEIDLTDARNVNIDIYKKATPDGQTFESRTLLTNVKIIGDADVKAEISPEGGGLTFRNVTLKNSKLTITNSQADKGSIVNCELAGENKLYDVNARESRLENCEIYEVDDIRDYDGSNEVVYSAKELTGSSHREVKSVQIQNEIADSSPKIDREELEL